VAERFTLDSNILVYALDSLAGEKHQRAVAVVDAASEHDCVLTIQALAEFFTVVARKGIVSPRSAAEQVEDWMTTFPLVAAGEGALQTALRLSVQGKLAFWDAMLLATAGQSGCDLVLSEDMHDGATIEGVLVRNPFAGRAIPRPIQQLLGLGE
jgi:predicted nucleic acid-binding protein